MFRYGRVLLLVLTSACVDLTPPVPRDNTDGPGQGGRDAGAGGAAGKDGRDGRLDPDGEAGPLPGDGSILEREVGEADATADAPLSAVGARCSEPGQCQSGFCADGHCCATACEGTCQACDLPGSEGTCGPVPAGQDLRDQCQQEPAASCGLNGSCDGQGACAHHAANTECAPGRCTAATEYAASTCDGAGMCRPGSSRSCAPGVCTGSSCATSCAGQPDCQTGFFCDAGKCVIRRAQGASCTMALQCGSGQCVDGFCCDTACIQSCYACNVSGKAGTCTPVPDGLDPQGECTAEAPATCGRAGGCSGKGSCRLHAAGVACQAAACSGFVAVSARSCNGLGVCQAGASTDCSPYLCGGAACATNCTSTSQCRPGSYCSGSACVPFGAPPVLHWKFDEAGGTTALDASGRGNHGSYFGQAAAPTSSPAVPPGSFSNPASRAFVASDRQAVRLAPAPAIIKPTTNLSVSLWFRTTKLDLGHNPPAASEALTLNDNYFIRVRAADIAFTRRGADLYLSCFAPVTTHLDGGWHHVVGVLSPAGMKVYVDGVERCSNTRGEPLQYDKGPDLFVGRHASSPDWDFDGNLDDVRIYDRALPPGEVAALAAGF
jgi:hypothetical protein